jgi:hypothetical protein
MTALNESNHRPLISVNAFLIAIALVTFCSSCTSSWDYVERAPGQGRVAVLKNPRDALPAFGEDYSRILKANAEVAGKGSGELNYQSTTSLRELFDRQDQGNAQLRNFLVTAYALYINGEFETNAIARDHARELWSVAVTKLQERAFASREIGLERDQQLERVKSAVSETIRNVAGLGLEGAEGKRLLSNLTTEVPKLEALERSASLQPSDTAILGRTLLAYCNHQYYPAIEKIPTLHTILPEQFYLLTAAYVRAAEDDPTKKTALFPKAHEAAKTLQVLAELAADSQLKARALNLEGMLADKERSDFAIARTNYEAALKLDRHYSLAWYNLGCTWSQTAGTNAMPTTNGVVYAIQCLNNYRIGAGRTAAEVLNEAAEDTDKGYNCVFAAYKRAFTDKWSDALVTAINNSEHPDTPPH